MASKYPFPYASVESAIQDHWKKCTDVTGDSARDVAIRIVNAGWYQLLQRNDQNDKAALARERVKRVMELAANDPALKAKIDAATASALKVSKK